MPAKTFEPDRVKMLTDLESIRLISDPLRLRLLEAFCEEERTTKQVAELLGEKPTRLYHHVDTLEKAGLIKLIRRRQVRGTVEKYYRAVAMTFKADSSAFDISKNDDSEGEVTSALQGVIDTLTSTVAEELRRLTGRGAASDQSLGQEGLLSLLEVRTSEANIEKLRGALWDILQELEADDPPEDEGAEKRRFRLMLTFYPLDR